jgi:uncharacterized protein (TIGR00251 family)
MPYLNVKVSPGARSDAIAGWLGDVLKVRVTAPPERGKANEAVCRLLAAQLGLPASAVSVSRGTTSRDKLVQVDGLDEDEIRRRLGAPMV